MTDIAQRVAEGSVDFGWSGGHLQAGTALALSGGGFRAMLFHAGALVRLNELGLLSKLKRISSVSGGSAAAGYLARIWSDLGQPNNTGSFEGFPRLYLEPVMRFSRRRLDVACVLLGLLPGNSGASMFAGKLARHLVGDLTLQDLPDEPRFVFAASNLQSGAVFRFSKPYAGDYLIGQVKNPNILLADAVAASSAFPPFLSPFRLNLPKGSFEDWEPPSDNLRELDFDRARAHCLLTDGGVYDNHGLEPVLKRYMTVLVSDGGAPFVRVSNVGWDWLRQLMRIVDLTDNQVRALRRRDLIDSLSSGKRAYDSGTLNEHDVRAHERLGAYWGIGTDPDDVAAPDCLPCDPPIASKLAKTPTRLTDLGEQVSKQLVNWGYAICDRSIRLHLRPAPPANFVAPTWPYSDEPLGGRLSQ